MLYGSISFVFIFALYLFYQILYPQAVGLSDSEECFTCLNRMCFD
jgi:hypothetical protein